MKPKRIWSWLWIVIGGLYFIIPLVATFLFSLQAKKSGPSLVAYQRVFTDPNFWKTFFFSLEMAVITILVSMLLVVPAAYWIRIKLPQLRVTTEFVTMMPFVIPAIVLVFGLIRVYSGPPFYVTNTQFGTNALLVGAYFIITLPYMYRAVDNGLAAINVRALTEAAQSLGSGWGRILLRIIFPNLRTAILSGALLTVTAVIGEYAIAAFLVGIKAFGPYMNLLGGNRTYESMALAIISFFMAWGLTGMIQFAGRGRTEVLPSVK
jgi:putative spermidine/putrescine transport system permease protein